MGSTAVLKYRGTGAAVLSWYRYRYRRYFCAVADPENFGGGDLKHKTSKIRMSSPKLRVIFRPKSEIQTFFSPKFRWSPKKKKGFHQNWDWFFAGLVTFRSVGGDASRNGAELFKTEADFSAKIVTFRLVGGDASPPSPPKSATAFVVPVPNRGTSLFFDGTDTLVLFYFLVGIRVFFSRLEAKAKDTKKIQGQGQGQGQPFRGQNLSRPRTGMLEAKDTSASALRKKKKVFPKIFQAISKKKIFQKFFRRSQKKKKKVFTKIFQAIFMNKCFPKIFSSAPQNFNNSKNSAVLEPRTGQFSRTWGLEAKAQDLTFEAKAKDFKMCPRGLHLW